LFAAFLLEIYTFRTFDIKEKILGLSYENPFLEDAYFWYCADPMPYIKHHTGFVCTKNTVAIIMMFPVKRFDVSEKLRRFLPHHCIIRRDFNHEYDMTGLYRNDFYYLGKKVGAIEDYTFRVGKDSILTIK
jgi:hypothetical protein